jgi:hypothetical protein
MVLGMSGSKDHDERLRIPLEEACDLHRIPSRDKGMGSVLPRYEESGYHWSVPSYLNRLKDLTSGCCGKFNVIIAGGLGVVAEKTAQSWPHGQ